MSKLEDDLAGLMGNATFCDVVGYEFPAYQREHRFHPKRRWRFDFAWLTEKVAIEVQGGVFVRGRHSRGRNQAQDMDKFNEALRLGWKVLQFSTVHINEQPIQTLETIRDLLKGDHL